MKDYLLKIFSDHPHLYATVERGRNFGNFRFRLYSLDIFEINKKQELRILDITLPIARFLNNRLDKDNRFIANCYRSVQDVVEVLENKLNIKLESHKL